MGKALEGNGVESAAPKEAAKAEKLQGEAVMRVRGGAPAKANGAWAGMQRRL